MNRFSKTLVPYSSHTHASLAASQILVGGSWQWSVACCLHLAPSAESEEKHSDCKVQFPDHWDASPREKDSQCQIGLNCLCLDKNSVFNSSESKTNKKHIIVLFCFYYTFFERAFKLIYYLQTECKSTPSIKKANNKNVNNDNEMERIIIEQSGDSLKDKSKKALLLVCNITLIFMQILSFQNRRYGV